MSVQALYKKALEKWGLDLQMIVLTEECAELIQAISHFLRENRDGAKEEIIEEITDVEIMIEQIKLGLNIQDEIFEKRIEKLGKLKKILRS